MCLSARPSVRACRSARSACPRDAGAERRPPPASPARGAAAAAGTRLLVGARCPRLQRGRGRLAEPGGVLGRGRRQPAAGTRRAGGRAAGMRAARPRWGRGAQGTVLRSRGRPGPGHGGRGAGKVRAGGRARGEGTHRHTQTHTHTGAARDGGARLPAGAAAWLPSGLLSRAGGRWYGRFRRGGPGSHRGCSR